MIIGRIIVRIYPMKPLYYRDSKGQHSSILGVTLPKTELIADRMTQIQLNLHYNY